MVSKVKNKSLAVYYSICRDYVLFLSLFIADLTAEIVFVIPMNRPAKNITLFLGPGLILSYLRNTKY